MELTRAHRHDIETMLREMPQPNYDSLCNFLGLIQDERDILTLRYRYRKFRPTREFVAEELGMSTSTLDRHLKALLKRINNFAQRLLLMLSL